MKFYANGVENLHILSIQLLTEEKKHLQMPLYCTELYNYKLKTDANILKDVGKIQTRDAPILKEEVGETIRILKNGKAKSVDNISDKTVEHRGPSVVNTLTNHRMSENLEQ